MCAVFFYMFQVFVNGIKAGSHTGGYDSFSFDINELLKEELAEQELIVVVEDPTESQVCFTLPPASCTLHPASCCLRWYRMKTAGNTSWQAMGWRGETLWLYLLHTNLWHLAGATLPPCVFKSTPLNKTVQTVWLEGVPEEHITKISVKLQLKRFIETYSDLCSNLLSSESLWK